MYGPSDLALPDRSCIFSHDCREYYPCNICPGCYVLDNGDSCSWLSIDVDQDVRLLFLDILVLVLPVVIDYFNGHVVHVALVLRLKLKLWENLHWYFQVSGSVLIGCLLENTRLCYGRRKSLKTSKICLFLIDFIL
jgi:hypothetical protein